jgi:hypothetical protein
MEGPMSPFIPAFLVSAFVCGGVCLLFLRASIAAGSQYKPTILGMLGLYVFGPLFAIAIGICIGVAFPAGMWDFGGIGGGGLGGFLGVYAAAVIASILRSNARS